MIDPRFHPVNTRVASAALAGHMPDRKLVGGTEMSVKIAVASLCSAPAGPCLRQLSYGAAVDCYEQHEGWSFVRSRLDGYVGYLPNESLTADARQTTHIVSNLATLAYIEEDLRAPDPLWLPFGAKLQVIDERRHYFETNAGFVPKKHLRPSDRPFSDPATVAQLFFVAPYLWGGNSPMGIDCSGLVQLAYTACGLQCPPDSDLQFRDFGKSLPADTTPNRGDLAFWDGHVAVFVDETVLLHANAHFMAVTYEPFEQARLRIAAQGGGPVICIKRPC